MDLRQNRKELFIRGHKQVVLTQNSQASGPPMVFIHGLVSSVYYLDDAHFDYFAQFGPVYSIPLPGHYPSQLTGDIDQFSFEEMVQTLLETIAELVENKPIILIGHSTGAQVALELASRIPDQVQGVMAIAGAPTGIETGASMVMMQRSACGGSGWLTRILLKLNTLNRFFHQVGMREVFADKGFVWTPAFRRFADRYFPAMQNLDIRVVVQYFRFFYDVEIWQSLTRIPSPVLLLVGDHDPYVPLQLPKEMALKCVDAEADVIKQSGHWPMYEQTSAFKKIFDDWYQRKI